MLHENDPGIQGAHGLLITSSHVALLPAAAHSIPMFLIEQLWTFFVTEGRKAAFPVINS